jgi:hypothetical protein
MTWNCHTGEITLNERVFCSEIVNSFKDMGYFAHKLTDAMSVNMHGNLAARSKPADIIASCHNGLRFVECKQFKKLQAFGIRHMEPSQIETFNFLRGKHGIESFVFVNVRQPYPRMNRLYQFKWAWLWEHFFKHGNSVKKKDFEQMGFTVGKKKRFKIDWM